MEIFKTICIMYIIIWEESMKKITITTLVLLTLLGCNAQFKEDNVKYVHELGFFTITKDEVLEKDTTLDNTPILNIYLEPTSGTALRLKEQLEEPIKTLLDNELIALRIHPLMYLNDNYTNNISSEIGTHLLSIVEYAPDSFESYLDAIYNTDYITQQIDAETLTLLEGLELNEQEAKNIEKNTAHYTPYLINGTQKYIDSNHSSFLEITLNDTKQEVLIDDFKNAEKALIQSVYTLLTEDKDKTEILKALWPDILVEKADTE